MTKELLPELISAGTVAPNEQVALIAASHVTTPSWKVLELADSYLAWLNAKQKEREHDNGV